MSVRISGLKGLILILNSRLESILISNNEGHFSYGLLADVLLGLLLVIVIFYILPLLKEPQKSKLIIFSVLFCLFLLLSGSQNMGLPFQAELSWLKWITVLIGFILLFRFSRSQKTAPATIPPGQTHTESKNDTLPLSRDQLNSVHINNLQLEEAQRIGRFGHYEWDVSRNEMTLSKGLIQLFDLKNDHSIRTLEDYLSFIDAKERTTERELLESFVKDKRFQRHYQRIITASGQSRIFITKGIVIQNANGEVDRIIGTSKDVTDIKKNKILLKQSQVTFKSAFDHSPVGMTLTSPDGLWLDVNQALCDMVGYKKEEMLRKNFRDITHPDDLQEDIQYVNKMLKQEIETYQMEKRYFKKNGDIVWVLLSVSLVWKEQEPAFFISQVVDITEQKRSLGKMASKNAELGQANLDLQHHIGQMNEFNRIVGHNLKGPASSLISIADHMELSRSEKDKQFLLSKVKTLSTSIIDTLNDLKEFIEIQLNKTTEIKSCSFSLAYESALRLLEEELSKSEARCEVNFEVEEVNFPRVYLESIFYNLLSNAIKYQKAGMVPLITVHSCYSDDYIVLSVQDNGIGIDLDKHRDEVFKYKKIFHKGYKSNGLGLFITKNQVEAYGGKIVVESEPEQGSTFSIYFRKNQPKPTYEQHENIFNQHY